MNKNVRCALNMTCMDCMIAMSDGNPGAITVMMQIMEHAKRVDPITEPFMAILWLDAHGIYGSQIWMLYKDVCQENIYNLLALLRHVQLGLSRAEDIMKPKDMDAVLAEVQEQIPTFCR